MTTQRVGTSYAVAATDFPKSIDNPDGLQVGPIGRKGSRSSDILAG